MKDKKIILISIIGLLIIGFFSLYNSLEITDGERDNYFNKTLKRVTPQNIKDFMKDTIFVFKKASVLEQKLADKNNQVLEILDYLNDVQLFGFKKNEIKNKKLHNINLSLKTFTLPVLKLTGPRSYLSYYNQNLFLITGTGILMYASLDDLKNEKFFFKRINTNFKDIVDEDGRKKKTYNGLVFY